MSMSFSFNEERNFCPIIETNLLADEGREAAHRHGVRMRQTRTPHESGIGRAQQRPQFPAEPSVAAGADSAAAVSPSACAALSQSALIWMAPT
jgi:hypothetical protein